MSRMTLQVVAIVGFAFLLFVGWDFSQRITLMVRRQQLEQEYDQRIAHAQATHSALEALKQAVQTDQYVEDKARRDYHYVRPGENLVIPQITPAAPAPNVALPSPVTAAPRTNWWQDLLDFLFGP